MVRITFLGTKGENEFSNRFHHGHTAWLLESGKTRLLFDFGKNHAGQLKDVKPTAIVVSHAHPDHVEGLKGEVVDVPVYMSRVTDGLLKEGYEGLKDRRILLEAKPVAVVDGITLTAFHTRHSSKAPSVAIKIETPDGTIGWVSDVISVMLGKQFFKSIELYIGDASYFHGGMVRTIRGELVGHTAVTTQLGWLGKHGVKQAIFSHFGDWIYQAGERRAREMLHEAAPGVTIYLARDGAVFHLRQGRVELGQGRTKGMSITDTLSELAEKARSVARSIETVTKAEPPPKTPKRAIVLDAPRAAAVATGKKTLVVKARLLEVAGQEIYLADANYIYGVVTLSKHKPISTAEFRRRFKEHKISEDERKSTWPQARKLFAYQVVEMRAFETPRPWTPPTEAKVATEPRFKRALKDEEIAAFTEEQFKSINGVRVVAEALLPLVDLFAQRAPKLMPVKQPVTELLPRMPWVVKSLVEEFGALCKQHELPPQTLPDGNLFDHAERLLCRLEEVTGFLPKKTRIMSVTDDAIEPLRNFVGLDAEFVEGDALLPAEPELAPADCYLEKFEKPRGRLPTLKMPDPAFNLQRLKGERSTGVLSRLERQGRVGERQFLINELEATKADGQYVWGVVTLDRPVKYDDLSKVPDATREGIDRFSKEEFSTESPVYYMGMQLVAAYDPPLRLKSPVASRRYGTAITLPDALAKSDSGPITSEDVPHQAVRQVPGEGPSLTWRGITPDKLKELTNDELKRLLSEVERLIKTEFREGKTSIGGGVSLEDATNAKHFIESEMSRRGLALACEGACEPTTKAGPSEQYAPCRGSGNELGEEIALEDVLPKFHDEFLLRAPFVHLCGGVVNNGTTKNDLDLLIKGPLDPVTFHVAKFRLARMLPPELAERVQFHGDGQAEGDVSAAGPFSAHIPLYDLVVRRREDSRAIIEMRDAGLLVDPLEVLLAKADPNLKLPDKEGTFPGVVQAHIRGASLHADFRVKQGDYLIGYTLSVQIPKTVPEFKTLAEAKAFVKDFNRDGTSWNKPLVAPGRVYATPKAPEPEEWLRIGAEEFAPGTVGATRFKKGYMIALAHPTVSRGKTEPYFQEYFCERDPKFYGLLNFRLLVSDAGKPGDPEVEAGRQMPQGTTFMTAMFTKSLLPSMLKKRAVDTGSIPPQGWAFLPPGLKAVVPKQFQYWHAKDEKERIGIRDALVSEGFFNESNIKLVDYEFRRVVTKYYLCDAGSDSIAYKHQPSPPADQLTGPAEVSQEEATATEAAVEVDKGLSKAPFALSWQRWKGQVVIRAAPSRQIFHLFVQRAPNELEDFQLMDDPTGGGPITAIRKVISSAKASELMRFEGEVAPGKEVGGVVLNATKGTPSSVSLLYRGEIDFLQDDRTFKKFRLKGKGLPKSLDGELVLRVEKGEGDIWIYEQSKSVGEPIERAEEVEKKERITTMALADGQHLANVQVWDPKDISPDDDKTRDRERLRPLAFYQPMKVAPRASNEFRSSDMDRLFTDFATEEMLKTGLIVEPKWNGFRASMQKDEKGRQLMISEDIWERKTPVSNFLGHLPGLKEELDKLPGPYVLDGEFMAVTSEGDPVPRRELADFRSTSAADDTNVRVHVFDILFSPSKGNVMAQPARERRAALQALLKGHKLSRVVLTPQRVVHSKQELLAAIEWARAIPGSEGAMLKSVESTVTLRETDSMAKLKMIREIRGIIWDAHPVKDSPGVHNFMYAVGPVSEEEAKTFVETVEIEGKTYVKAGKTFNTKLNARVGDVVRIEVTELLFDSSNPEKKRLRGFTPTVIDRVDQPPSDIKEILELLDPGELKKSEAEARAGLAKNAGRRFAILKQGSDEEQYVFGVVLEPETFDSQGDIYDAETVRQAAYHFMRKQHILGYMHESLLANAQYEVLENYLAPVAFELEGQPVKQGTWLLGARITDPRLWEDIKAGRLTGWSIEGTALVEEIR